MTELVVHDGRGGSSALAKREDLSAYSLQVEWDEEDRWRETQVVLPSGAAVGIDQFVGVNFETPRQYHPEYALAIELLLTNAVVEAKSRGFRVASVELGMWPYKTLITMGKRITKVGLDEPILREDGRTETYTAYQWIDHEGEGVLILPWANGDQLIRLKDSRGYYVVPIDERTADASKCPQASGWKAVESYPQLAFEGEMHWSNVPLLESADVMVEQLDCQHCLFLFPVKPWSFVKDNPSRKRVCQPCREDLKGIREEAKKQGWDYDKGRPLPVQKKPQASRYVQRLVNPHKCTHKWGIQMEGTSNAALPEERRASEGMRIKHVCIICGAPDPKHLPKSKKA